MRTYSVHHRLSSAEDLAREVDGLVFVKEGFCWPALFVPGLWLLFRGLWLVLVGYLLLETAVVVGAGLAGLSENASFLLALVPNVVLAFEGNDLRRWTLERRGYRLVGLASGRRLADAERRFLESLADGSYKAPAVPVSPMRPTSTPRHGTWARPETEDEVIGLFPTPERGR